jgi:tRNA threonylcarbamoyladenosine modification (KEOPS) complex  Pcc1 subunit
MNYYSSILIKTKDPSGLIEIFEPEQRNSARDRSSYKIEKDKEGVRFEIEAMDSVSLRSTLNSITKLLTVYEKLK